MIHWQVSWPRVRSRGIQAAQCSSQATKRRKAYLQYLRTLAASGMFRSIRSIELSPYVRAIHAFMDPNILA